jgi:hypothetical protein
MARKPWLLVAVAVVLGGFSLYLNKDWFMGDRIQIYHRARPMRVRPGRVVDLPPYTPVFFGFMTRLKLTDVKVVPVCELETNKYPHVLWHLLSDSNSLPTKGFLYGGNVPGMRPALKGVAADPLEPGVKYRLLVEARSKKGQHDFIPEPQSP